MVQCDPLFLMFTYVYLNYIPYYMIWWYWRFNFSLCLTLVALFVISTSVSIRIWVTLNPKISLVSKKMETHGSQKDVNYKNEAFKKNSKREGWATLPFILGFSLFTYYSVYSLLLYKINQCNFLRVKWMKM